MSTSMREPLPLPKPLREGERERWPQRAHGTGWHAVVATFANGDRAKCYTQNLTVTVWEMWRIFDVVDVAFFPCGARHWRFR